MTCPSGGRHAARAIIQAEQASIAGRQVEGELTTSARSIYWATRSRVELATAMTIYRANTPYGPIYLSSYRWIVPNQRGTQRQGRTAATHALARREPGFYGIRHNRTKEWHYALYSTI